MITRHDTTLCYWCHTRIQTAFIGMSLSVYYWPIDIDVKQNCLFWNVRDDTCCLILSQSVRKTKYASSKTIAMEFSLNGAKLSLNSVNSENLRNH